MKSGAWFRTLICSEPSPALSAPVRVAVPSGYSVQALELFDLADSQYGLFLSCGFHGQPRFDVQFGNGF